MDIVLRKEYLKFINYWLISLLIFIAIIVIVGGLTRLTDSGLSITTWDVVSGILPPLNTNEWEKVFNLYKEIPEYKVQNYSMSMNEFKVIFWWEWVHRFLGRLVGIAFLIPLIIFTIKIKFNKLISLYFIFHSLTFIF